MNRTDLVQLQQEKIGKFNYDGLDNWNILNDVKNGWWSQAGSPGGLYPPANRLVWPD